MPERSTSVSTLSQGSSARSGATRDPWSDFVCKCLERGPNSLVHIEITISPQPTAEDDGRQATRHLAISRVRHLVLSGSHGIVGIIAATGSPRVLAKDYRRSFRFIAALRM